MYPLSNAAASVLDVLRFALEQQENIRVRTGCVIRQLKRREGQFLARTEEGDTITAQRCILAAGGAAGGKLGGGMDGYQLARQLGHHRTALYPSLVQVCTDPTYPRGLKGVKAQAALTLTREGETLTSGQGEVLFTDYGLSGIAVMDVSWAVGQNFARPRPQKCCAVLDLIPEWSENQLLSYLRQFGSLRGILSAEVTEILEKQAAGDPARLVQIAKHWQLIVTGTKGYAFAQITGGGVPRTELEGFASRRVPGLYIVGEVLDEQQPCGGYNLNFAFYSGLAAAGQMVEKRNDTSK